MGGSMSESSDSSSCACLGGRLPSAERRFVGVDRTGGRYGEVTVERCGSCGRYWLEYRVEYEFFTASGRWFRGLIDAETAQRVTPESAVATLEALDGYFFGGSYFGHAGRWRSGPLRADL
jgi:hypothetical protein